MSSKTTFAARLLGIASLTLLSMGWIGCDKKDAATTGAGNASGGGGAAAPKKLIGVSLLTLDNPFFKEMGDAMTAQGAKNGYDVRITSSDNDAAKQRNQVHDFMSNGAVAIILTPADSNAVGTAIRDANDKNVPVFTADVACKDATAKVVAHAATDNLAGGRQLGEAAVAALGEHGKIAILDQPAVESAQLRVQGFKEGIAGHPGLEIVASLPGLGNREKSFAATQDILQAHPDVELIFAINDPSALGVVAALEQAGKVGKVKVFGFDGQLEVRQAVRDGKVFADAMQSPTKIGQMAVDNVMKYLAGDKVEATTLIPTTIYKKADADAEFGGKGAPTTAPAH